MFLVLSMIFFILFVGHVLFSAFWGALLVGDIGELILLVLASVSFVAAILKVEKVTASKQLKY